MDDFLSDNDFQSDEESFLNDVQSNDQKQKKTSESFQKKEKKTGIVYLSSVPTSMNVKKLSEFFSSYGELGRIFLKPAGI